MERRRRRPQSQEPFSRLPAHSALVRGSLGTSLGCFGISTKRSFFNSRLPLTLRLTSHPSPRLLPCPSSSPQLPIFTAFFLLSASRPAPLPPGQIPIFSALLGLSFILCFSFSFSFPLLPFLRSAACSPLLSAFSLILPQALPHGSHLIMPTLHTQLLKVDSPNLFALRLFLYSQSAGRS